VLLHPVDGINAGGAWREPGPWGIGKSISDGVNCSSAKPEIRRVQLWPTIIWPPIQGKAPGWELEETPDLDGLMVPLGGYREIATRWTTFRVFSDRPSIASVYPIARPGGRRVGTAVSVFGKATGQRITSRHSRSPRPLIPPFASRLRPQLRSHSKLFRAVLCLVISPF
jgi:hypothetical protein